MILEDEDFIDELLNLPSFSNAIRSPDGKYIAFIASGLHDNVDVFLFNNDKQGAPKPLTNTAEYTDLIDWWPDSESIIVSQDIDGDERETYYRIFIDRPNEFIPITEEKPDFFIRGGSLSTDGNYLYYSVNYDFTQKKEEELYSLIKHDLKNNSKTILAKAQKPGSLYPEVNRQGTKILYNRQDLDPAGIQYWLINADGTSDKEILNFGIKAKVDASWHPDSNRILFTTDRINNSLLEYNLSGIYEVDTGRIIWINKKGESIHPELERLNLPICYVDEYEEDIIILGELKKAKTQYYLYQLNTGNLIKLPRLSGNIVFYNKLPNNRWLCGFYSSIQPATIISISDDFIDQLKVKDFFYYYDNFTSSKLDSEDLIQAEDYEWASVDDESIHGWYYESKENTKALIVYVHGGPTAHSRDALNIEIQYYLYKGFNVLDPNYRGSTGYGIAFMEKIKEEGWGGKEQADIAWGVKSLIDSGRIEKGKVAITGTSYGGYSSWCAITKYPDIFDISIPVCGMTDLVVDYETTRPDLRPYSEEMMGGTPDQVPERYYNGSPINFINRIKGKILIVQGANDPNVTPTNVDTIENALKKGKIKYEKLIFVDEGHGIIRKENRKKKYQEIAKFVSTMINDV